MEDNINEESTMLEDGVVQIEEAVTEDIQGTEDAVQKIEDVTVQPEDKRKSRRRKNARN